LKKCGRRFELFECFIRSTGNYCFVSAYDFPRVRPLLSSQEATLPSDGFGIGFGPNIIKKQIGETEFRVGILLFGAYVEVPAMDGEGNETIKPLHKVAIALAGPLMNFILAFLVVFVVLVSGNPLEPSAVVGSIVPNSSAAEVLQVGDKILQVDGKSINSFEDFQRSH